MNFKNIVIAVDGSPHSANAVKKGLELAAQLSATVTLLNVVDMASLSAVVEGSIMSPDIYTRFEEEADEIMNKIALKFPTEKMNKVVEEGIPWEVICKTAIKSKADLIVMGTHGRTGISHLFMGSVSESVVRHSEIPVLVVPFHEPE